MDELKQESQSPQDGDWQLVVDREGEGAVKGSFKKGKGRRRGNERGRGRGRLCMYMLTDSVTRIQMF